MQSLNLLQESIHKMESSSGLRYLKLAVFILSLLSLSIRYDVHSYQNMSSPSAMDAAQLGRNIAEGRGYTTLNVRPFSIYLVKKHSNRTDDAARLKSGHPDISNAPVYPVVLAGLMKILPFHFDAGLKGSFWSISDSKVPGGRIGVRYQPDFLITLFNQFLFFAMVALVFFWARRMFDFYAARLSVFLLLLSEMLWHFSASGLSTMLLLLIFMLLVWCLTLWESEVREPKRGLTSLVLLSVAAGVLTGVGALTRYSFLSMIVPVLLFLGIFGGQRRIVCCVSALFAFALVLTPWIVRNYSVSGTPFGTAGFAFIESFSGKFRLERTLQPEFPHYALRAYFSKICTNLVPALQEDLFKTDGGWIVAFFMVGLMMGFRNLGLRRLRYFAVGSLVTLAITQALTRTQLSDETPGINSENMLVLLSPMVVVFGVGAFYTLLDNIKLPFPQLRYAATFAFIFLLRLPLWFTLLFAPSKPVAYPTYRPDLIQYSAHLMKEDELMMSDVPWAVAWYGNRQCVWLTLNATAQPDDQIQWQESFFAINDTMKPIHGLYLTQRTMDGRFLTEFLRGGELSWGCFVLNLVTNKGKFPPGFPLTKAAPGFWPDQLLLCDWVRW